MLLEQFRISIFLCLGVFQGSNTQTNKKCPQSPSFGNGLAQTSEVDSFVGQRLRFKCAPGFIIGNERETDLVCVETNQGPQWVWPLDHRVPGCRRGCLNQEDCDWGMACDALSHECQYLTCPAQIPNALLAFDNQQPGLGKGNVIGQFATLSCLPGYFVQHPDSFVTLARTGFQLKDYNVQVQCQQLENNEMAWVLLYRQSTGMADNVYGDILHSSSVPVQCLQGCRSDAGCPLMSTCYEKQCLPKVCPPQILEVPNSVLLKAKSAKVGTVVKARCDQGFVIKEIGFNRPFEMKCEQPIDQRKSPGWVLHAEHFNNLKCVPKGACSVNEDCPGNSQNLWRCMEGVCVQDCADVPNGKIVQERHVSSKTGEETCVADDEPSFSISNKAKLQCEEGYIVNNPISGSDSAKIVCSHDSQGSRWRYLDMPKQVAECIRGCLIDSDCPMGEVCSKQTAMCQESMCQELDPNQFHGKIVNHTSGPADFVCDPGFIYINGLDQAVNTTKVICGRDDVKNKTEQIWIEFQGQRSLRPCQPGCMDDLGCGFEEHCDSSVHICRPSSCPCLSKDPNAVIMDCQTSRVEAFASVQIKCNPGYMFNLPLQPQKSLDLICNPINQTLCHESSTKGYLEEPPLCEPGCVLDSDCPKELICRKRLCQARSCVDGLLDPNAMYNRLPQRNQAVKFCHRNFKIFNGVDLVGSIQLECNPEDKTLSWRTSTGQEDPPCLELCSNSTKCSNPDQTCQKGACMSTKCDEEIPNGQIEAKGSNGVLVCSPGYVSKTSRGCSSEINVQCALNRLTKWVSEGEVASCQPGCLNNESCNQGEECDLKSCRCVPPVCFGPRKLIGGNIEGPATIRLGMTVTLTCSPGFIFRRNNQAFKSVKVQCSVFDGIPRYAIGGIPIQGCDEGCLNNEDCSRSSTCKDFKCLDATCSMNDPNALLDSPRGLKPTPFPIRIRCKPGTVMNLKPKAVKEVEVVCNEPSDKLRPFLSLQTGDPVPRCIYGCAHDWDCPLDQECTNGECVNAKRCKVPYSSKNGKIEKHFQKHFFKCAEGYRLHSGSIAIEVECSDYSQDWTLPDGRSLPWCCKCPKFGVCAKHCPRECPIETFERSGMTIVAEYGNLVGNPAALLCQPGYVFSGSAAKCSKLTNITCGFDNWLGPFWTLVEPNSPLPNCIKLVDKCCTNEDCLENNYCDNSTCVPMQCLNDLTVFGGTLLNPHNVGIGTINIFQCQNNPKESTNIFCSFGDPPLWKMFDGKPLKPCVSECSKDKPCPEDHNCDPETKRCLKSKGCPQNIPNGITVPLRDNRKMIVCKPGYKLVPDVEGLAICSNDENWTSPKGQALSCQPGCSFKYPCSEGKICVNGRCSPKVPCPSGIPFSNGHIIPQGEGQIGDKVIFECDPGFEQPGVPFLELECSDKGWITKGPVSSLPQCRKASESCPTFDSAMQAHFEPIVRELNLYEYNCLPGQMQPNGLVKGVAKCKNGNWLDPNGKTIAPCNKSLKCKKSSDCSTLEKCVDSECVVPTCNPNLDLPNSDLVVGDVINVGSSGMLVCKDDFVLESMDDPIMFQPIYCGFNQDTGHVEWLTQSTSQKVKDCTKGCKTHVDCSSYCAKGKCAVASDAKTLCSSFQNFDGTTECKSDTCILECPKDTVIFDPNIRPPLSSSMTVQCVYLNGSGHWTFDKEQVLIDPKCVPIHCMLCNDKSCQESDLCGNTCPLEHVPSHLKLVQTIKDGSADFSCKDSNQRLLQYFWNKAGTGLDSFICLGSVFSSQCETSSSGMVPFWSKLRGSEMPICAQACFPNERNCQCSALDICHEKCSTCIPNSFDKCSKKGRCSDWSKSCDINPRLSEWQCLPKCETQVPQGNVRRESNGRSVLQCDFHFAVDHLSVHGSKAFVTCSYATCQPTWILSDPENMGKPAKCVFDPVPCNRQDLMFIPNAKIQFQDGTLDTKARRFYQQRAQIRCNNFHYLQVRGEFFKNDKTVQLSCQLLKGVPRWTFSDGTPLTVGALRCEEGCITNADCHKENYFCDKMTHSCIHSPCPEIVPNGDVTFVTRDGHLRCHPGHVLAYPNILLQKAFIACQQQNRCNILPTKETLVKCQHFQEDSGHWMVSIQLPNQVQKWKTTTVAECVPNCKMDADCSEGLQCVPLNPFCQDCDDKYCVQTSCNDPDKSFHGRVIKSRFICDRMYGMPKEKDPFLDVACSLNPQDGSMIWTSQKAKTPIVPCQKQCRTFRDCARNEECESDGYCYPTDCPQEINGGKVGLNPRRGPTFSCPKGSILVLGNESYVGDMPVQCSKVKGSIPMWKSLEKPTETFSCIPGCLDDTDCSYPKMCLQSSGMCAIPKCPDLFVKNSDLKVPLRNVSLGSIFEIHCKEGFVIPKQEARKLKCILGKLGPKWTTEDNDRVQDCVPGCSSCSDCQAHEECFHHVCVPLTCSQLEIESHRGLDCSNGQYSIGVACRFKTGAGFLEGQNLTKYGSAKCVENGECDPHNRAKRSTWTLPDVVPGCHPDTQEEDCEPWEECRVDLGHQCQLKRCSLKMDHGVIQDVGQSTINESNPKSSGQFGTLICSPGFAIGYDPIFSTLKEVPQLPWMEQAHVECRYLNGKYPIWSTFSNIPVACFKTCQDQSDCSIHEICSRSRCVPGKCQVPQSSAVFEPCSKIQGNLKYLPIGSSSSICCQSGYVSNQEPKAKSFRLVCETDRDGYPVLSQDPVCVIGCTPKTESQDCLRNQMCVDHQCMDQHCEVQKTGNADIEVFDLKDGKAPIGSRGVLHCRKGFIYPLPNKGHSHFIPVGCIRSPVGQVQGQWALLWQSDHPIQIKECVPGCILDEDCSQNSFCNSDLQCELLQCPLKVKDLDHGKVVAKERTFGSYGTIQCEKGFFRKFKAQEAPLIKCCQSEQGLFWGNSMDCSSPQIQCLPGCTSNQDCRSNEDCVNNQCQPKSCINDDMSSSILKDRRLVQVLEVGAEGIKICKNGFLMEESLKIKPVVCEGKNVPNLVDYDGRSLPNCLKGCLNDLDCQVEQGRCIKGVCMGGCSIPEIRNSMPLINAPKQIPLGSELDVQCQVGYLNYNGEQQGTFACRPTSQGPKLCPKMGNCRDPMCIEGCRNDQDCRDSRQICVIGSPKCSSQACCESVKCPMIYKMDPRAKLEPLNGFNLMDEGFLTCPEGMVFQPQSGRSLLVRPSSITKVKCVQGYNGGEWMANPKNLLCVEGCNRDNMPCKKPCHQCDMNSWQCVPSPCSNFIRNGRLLSQDLQLGIQTHAWCNHGSYARTPNGTLQNVVQLKCECFEDVPKWIWPSEQGKIVPFDGCITEFCRTDEDCSDAETCSTRNKCQPIQCLSKVQGLRGDLTATPNGQFHLICHEGFAVQDINDGTITSRIPVECVHKMAERKMVWIPKGHPECAYHDNVKCDFGCNVDKDCNTNEQCQIFQANDSIKHCVSQTCSKPYKQTHGEVLDFPTSGLKESDHVDFHCHPGYGMKPSRLSPFVRTSLQIFCLRNAEPGTGIRLGYFLQNGAQVPLCLRGVCSKNEDCYPNERCFQQTCLVRACSNISPLSNSHLFNPAKRFNVSESTIVKCNQGHVIKWNGKCLKDLEVTCFLPETSKLPIWLPMSNPTSNRIKLECQKGCSINTDCGSREFCDQSQCACRPKECPSLIPFGILLDLTGLKEGHQGRLQCQAFKEAQPVKCLLAENGKAFWHDQLSKTLAKCPQVFPERCQRDKQCPRGSKCQNGVCSPTFCTVMEQGGPKTISVGDRMETQCPRGSIYQDGTDRKYKYCLLIEEQASLDFLKDENGIQCVTGCLMDENCESVQICQSGICSTPSCTSNFMGSGGVIIPNNGTLVGSHGILACERGFLVENQKTTSIVCNHDRQWTVPRSKSIPRCDPGCIDDRDCSLMERCHQMQCIPKTCSADILSDNLNSERVSNSGYLTRTKMVCKKGFQIPGSNQTSLEIQCEADEITPKWRTLDGLPLPPCLQPCSKEKCKTNERCDPLLGYCIPLQCNNQIERNYGTIIKVGEDFKEGSLHLFQCDPGFRLNPTVVNGEHMENVTVLCHKNVLIHSLDWILPDGRLVPECIPGCQTNEDCDITEQCDHHDCVLSHCPIIKTFSGQIILDNSGPLIGSPSSFVPIGTRGVVKCDPGYYPQEDIFPNTVEIFCSKESPDRFGTFEDQFGEPLKSCQSGCKRNGNCPKDRPKCDLKQSKCVECLKNEDCLEPGQICSDHGTCSQCERNNLCYKDQDCKGGTKSVCDQSRHICVTCNINADCAKDEVCGPNQECSKLCFNDIECPKACHSEWNICVECKYDQHCFAPNQICSYNGACQPRCFSDKDCPFQGTCSKGHCLAKSGQCFVDRDCSPFRPICSPWNNTCVECTSNAMCQSGQCQNGICSKISKAISTGCKTDSDCKGVEPVCDKTSGICVTCLENTHCPNSESSVCLKSKQLCTQCLNSGHCHASQRCIPSDGNCQRVCSKDLQCSRNEKCAFLGHCSLVCNQDRDCQTGLVCHPQEKTCVPCFKSEDCPMGRPVCFQGDCYEICSRGKICSIGFCDPMMDICRAECLNDDQCVGLSARKKCDPKTKLCLECLTTKDCNTNKVCLNGSCEEGCLENSDCFDPTPICDKSSNKCVECLSASDCNIEVPFCKNNKCQSNECSRDKDCSKDHKCLGGTCQVGCREDHECQIPNKFCHKPSHSCHECLTDPDCPQNNPLCVDGECEQCIDDTGCPSGFHCLSNNCHEGCFSDRQCRSEQNSRCDVNSKTCVQCLTNKDCPLMEPVCSQGKCNDKCASHKDCPNQLVCIGSKCTEGCTQDSDCLDIKPVCDREHAVCVRCMTNRDCTSMFPYCREHECFGTCLEDKECSPGSLCLNGTCIKGCRDSRDCSPPTPLCEPGKHQCVQCLDSSSCPLNRPRCLEFMCQGECSTNSDCSTESPICDQTSLKCVQCREQSDCPDSRPNCVKNKCQGCQVKSQCKKGFICPSGTCLKGCETDGDCPADIPVCNVTRSQCVECLEYFHCPRNHFCSKEKCLEGCESDYHCSKSKPKCHVGSKTCQMCLESGDCPRGSYCSSFQCSSDCQSDSDCTGAFKYCSKPIQKCSECTKHEHCSNGQYCKDFKCESGCNDDSHCPTNKPRCDTRFRVCVECQSNTDCDPGFRCSQGTCSNKCSSVRDCFPSHPYCNGLECVQCLEQAHCGPESHCKDAQCHSGCQVDGNCPKSAPKCLVSQKTCVICLESEDCPKGKRCNQSHECTTQCTNDQDCLSIGMVCHDQNCVPCSKSAHCPIGLFCEQYQCQQGCSKNSDCSSHSPICDLVQRKCFECLESSHCPSGLNCNERKCTDSCKTDLDCSTNIHKVCSESLKKCVECRSNNDCAKDEFCSDFKCLKGCRDNLSCPLEVPLCDKSSRTCVQCLEQSQCPKGSFCQSHSCTNSCSKDIDCLGKWKYCQDRQCRECRLSAHCPKGTFCSNLTCKPGCGSNQDCFGPEPICDTSKSKCVACLTSSECPRGSFCQNQSCLQGCQSNKDCAQPLPICEVPKNLCVECLVTSDCNQGFLCRDKKCQLGCGSNPDCLDPKLPICRLETNKCVECGADQHCPTDFMCRNNQCTDQCRTDQDCKAIPNKPVCSQALSKCVRCSTNDHCSSGQFCADNNCRNGCLKDQDCMKPDPYCDQKANTCHECLKTHHCIQGFYCKDRKCIKGCQDESNCPPDSPHCDTSMNLCHSIRRFPKYCQGDADCFAPKPFCTDQKQCAACIRQMDCPRSKPYCIDGRCSECDTPRDCKSGLVCRHGFCKPPNPNCILNKDCPTTLPNCDKYLLKCIQCFTKRDCAPTEFCNFGDCIPDDTFLDDVQVVDTSCRSDIDCPKDMTCRNGQCVSGPIKCRLNIECPKALPNCDKYSWTCVECFTQDDCKSGQFCDHNACVRVEEPPPAIRCRTDQQCPPNQQCQRSVCKAARKKCFLNEDCPSQVPHCDKYLLECLQCSTNKDCPRNQFCDHGDCVV